MSEPALIEIRDVSRRFVKRLDLAGKIAQRFGAKVREEIVHAVDRVSFGIGKGEVVDWSASRAAANPPSGAWWREFWSPARAPSCTAAGGATR